MRRLLCTPMAHPRKAVAITCEGEAHPLSRACAIFFIHYKRASDLALFLARNAISNITCDVEDPVQC